MKKLGPDFRIVDDSQVKPRSQIDNIMSQEPLSAFGVRRSLEQLDLKSHHFADDSEQVTLFDLNDDLPKSGALRTGNGSAKMHPTDHISIGLWYLLEPKMTSGALYHLVAMYSVLI